MTPGSVLRWMLLPMLFASTPILGSGLHPVVDLPAGKDDVVRFGDGTGVDRQAAVTLLDGGGFLVVYPNLADGALGSATLRIASSADGVTIGPPRKLSFGGAQSYSAAVVRLEGRDWLYFTRFGQEPDSLELWRTRISGGSFAVPERLPDIASLAQASQDPRWVAFPEGAGVTFRGPGSIPMWGISVDGAHWGATTALASEGVAYPRVVPLATTGCFFSYQRPPKGGYMATYVSVSKDCKQWSRPVPIAWPAAPNLPDVHDAYALPRKDGGVDLYYVYPSFKGDDARFPVGFDLYRRAIGIGGTLGPEQLLTERKEFFPFTPAAHRLADGRVLVTFSDIEATGAKGVSAATISAFVLGSDAPAPPAQAMAEQ